MRKLLLLPALLITPTLLALTLASGCQNTLRPTVKPNAWLQSDAVRSGQALVWTDLQKASLDCGEALLVSTWEQLFPVPADDPHSSGKAQLSWGEVRGVSSARGVSVAALGIEISIENFAKISLSDASGTSLDSKSVLSITKGGDVRNLEFGPGLFPRLVALFSPATIGRRQNPSIPADLDPVVDLHFRETAQKVVEVQVAPPIEGVAQKISLEVGEYSQCLRAKLKLTDVSNP